MAEITTDIIIKDIQQWTEIESLQRLKIAVNRQISDVNEKIKMDEFVKELMKITDLSKQYCVAAWYTTASWLRDNPATTARAYKDKFGIDSPAD